MLIYLLIISLHNRSLQTFFFPFISDLVELFTLVYFYLPITPTFFFLSEEMSVFERLETNKWYHISEQE